MTENKAGGIFLIIIGIIITTVWLTVYGFQLYGRWYDFNIAHNLALCTYWEYFWDMGKLQMCLALLFGSVPGIAGICFLFKKSYEH